MKKANISWVTDHIAVGGDLAYHLSDALDQMQDIMEQDIELVIDLRQEATDEHMWRDSNVTYVHLPTDDRFGHHIPAEIFDNAVHEAARVVDGGGKVLLHCHMGINRGPSAAYAVLLHYGYDVVDAFDLIRSKRPEAAIAYAMDALFAHQGRQEKMISPYEDENDRRRLRYHIRSIWTPEEERRIAHIIRGKHQEDQDAWAKAQQG